MIPQFEPTTSPEQVAGFLMIYVGAIMLFVSWLHCLEDSWKKNLKVFLAMTFIPWSIVGILAIPAYAMAKHDAERFRLLIAGASLVGAAMLFGGIHFCSIT